MAEDDIELANAWFRRRLCDRWNCKLPGHTHCYANLTGIHVPLTEEAMEIWVEALVCICRFLVRTTSANHSSSRTVKRHYWSLLRDLSCRPCLVAQIQTLFQSHRQRQVRQSNTSGLSIHMAVLVSWIYDPHNSDFTGLSLPRRALSSRSLRYRRASPALDIHRENLSSGQESKFSTLSDQWKFVDDDGSFVGF